MLCKKNIEKKLEKKKEEEKGKKTRENIKKDRLETREMNPKCTGGKKGKKEEVPSGIQTLRNIILIFFHSSGNYSPKKTNHPALLTLFPSFNLIFNILCCCCWGGGVVV